MCLSSVKAIKDGAPYSWADLGRQHLDEAAQRLQNGQCFFRLALAVVDSGHKERMHIRENTGRGRACGHDNTDWVSELAA